jgi:hypothetical protein
MLSKMAAPRMAAQSLQRESKMDYMASPFEAQLSSLQQIR